MQYYYECSYSIVGINDLPVELIDEVAKYQTQDELYRNLRVCKAWLPSFERRLYMCPRVSSEAGMQKLLRALALPRLNFRRSILSLNIRGKANYSSFTPTTWVLSMPETLGKHFPALQSLTFESLEGVSLTTNFWSAMGSVSMQIMELRIVRSRLGREDAEKLMITFPNLRYLSLTNVRWAPKKDKRFSVRLRDWVKRSVPIERLELADMDREELLDVLPWAVYSSLETLHDLELQRVGVRDLHKLIPYIAQLRLHSLALTPLVPNGTHPGQSLPPEFKWNFADLLFDRFSLRVLRGTPESGLPQAPPPWDMALELGGYESEVRGLCQSRNVHLYALVYYLLD